MAAWLAPLLLAVLLGGSCNLGSGQDPVESYGGGGSASGPAAPPKVNRTITAHVVALDQPYMWNRLGASQPNAVIYALARDVVPTDYDPANGAPPAFSTYVPGKVRLRADKRPRPLVLRAAEGDLLKVVFTNLLEATPGPKPVPTATRYCGFHAMGLELYDSIGSDASWVGQNPGVAATATQPGSTPPPQDQGGEPGSLCAPGQTKIYTYYAKADGTFLVNSLTSNQPLPNQNGQLQNGMFGVVNVQPAGAEFYRSQVTRVDLDAATYHVNAGTPADQINLPMQPGVDLLSEGVRNMTITLQKGRTATVHGQDRQVWTLTSVTPAPPSEAQKRTVKTSDVVLVPDETGLLGRVSRLYTLSGQHLVNYEALYAKGAKYASGQPIPDSTPVLSMLMPVPDPDQSPDRREFELINGDLTAMITGPDHDRFPYSQDSPLFRNVPASPDRRQPYREITIVYHYNFQAVQAFPQLNSYAKEGGDFFAINYGCAGIGAEIIANRIGVGPMGQEGAVDPKFEEFFLSSWTCGDPAMIVDVPANATGPATKAFYPDDPSNVYHSYMRDHVKFRVLNASDGISHVHHQHAHQWLHSPNSDNGHYLDSQTVVSGSGYTMEMVYNGSGNRNQTVGDSIFHCHFYPHFAEGMWSLWRVHDVYEGGTALDGNGRPKPDVHGWVRALPDGEIEAGTPIPALAPLPTIAMAPLPARVRLQDKGRYVEVEEAADPEQDKNPGYPFFIPGLSGHRPPHPPMDFAWREDDSGVPILGPDGKKIYLNGGLPRHLAVGGTLVSNFFTPFDFTKEFIAFNEDGSYKAGSLNAVELPEEGTRVEQTAMRTHATRAHASYLPDGQPGNFILNGLPPVPGAPYAAPSVREDGDSNINTRRYKAAVIQIDAVLNKKGWHYPQQRMLTLWGDVGDTVAQKRPPQPFFFRANSDETIEYWHTNLVPNYYEMDDFQVRTPTDVLGQHIHLVKFDVTSSDGAANGFNYEDGTFSPDEVRGRIAAINAAGGLAQPGGGAAKKLEVVPVAVAYPDPANPGKSLFGDPPPFQDWNGAQTTVQRFDTDPLLNNEGEDRTVRSVFTHDHFSPSTHQQAGYYAALLVEPANSTWEIPVIKTNGTTPTVEYVRGGTRYDGGPTSWQANIVTDDPSESYREFALEFQDMQLAYLNTSTQVKRSPLSTWPLPGFKLSTDAQNALPTTVPAAVPAAIRSNLASTGITMSDKAKFVTPEAHKWQIDDPVSFSSFQIDGSFLVYTPKMEPGWADPANAIAPHASKTVPQPQLISFGTVGTYSVNYRNDPLPLRLTPGSQPNATDLAYAYASIPRNDTQLNSQPPGGGPINPGPPPDGEHYAFAWPQWPVSLDMEGTDPYTPLMRAYSNDRVQLRVLAGAHLNVHSFLIHGAKYLFEPSSKNSGYRTTQAISLSEHFEMNFTMPPQTSSQQKAYADFLYAPASSTQGQTSGAWGILRSYSGTAGHDTPASPNYLKPLPNNPQGQAVDSYGQPVVLDFEALYNAAPADRRREYHVCAQTVDSLIGGPLEYNSRGQAAKNFPFSATAHTNLQDPYALVYVNEDDIKAIQAKAMRVEPLILRANAGDWIKIHLHNSFADNEATFNDKENQGVYPALNPFKSLATTTGKPNINLRTPTSVGLHPQLVAYDITAGDGMNVGGNPYATIGPNGDQTLYWYAGDISVGASGDVVQTPIEFGSVNLTPADPLLQHRKGLIGALVVEPEGSEWPMTNAELETGTDGKKTRAIATVKGADGSTLFREFVAVMQTDAFFFTGPQTAASGSDPAGAPSTGGTGINYKTEPLQYRYSADTVSNWQEFLPGGTAARLANSLVGGDPQTPVFTAIAGQPVRFRWIYPRGGGGNGGGSSQVPIVHGHVFQEEPFVHDSTKIGDNPLSQWLGGQLVVPGQTLNMLFPAGGSFAVPGDYMYGTFIGQTSGGGHTEALWGVFRVR